MTPSKLISTADRTFIDKATQGGLFEVESSRLALDKNASAQNRSFANMMITDHSKANQALEKLVREKGGRVPTVLDTDLQAKLDDLRHKEGAAFDRAYHEAQVKAHDDAIALFESASRDCDDPELKAFAAKTLPTLRMHRSHLDVDEGGISAGDL
jgi:putative membrane protein